MTMEKPFKLTIGVAWWMRIALFSIAFAATVLSFFALVSALRDGVWSLFVFLLLGFMAYICWANALSAIEITAQSVTVTVFYGRFRIPWNEIKKIVVNGPLIALIGDDKRVVLSLAFAGGKSQAMLGFLREQIESRGIKFEENGLFPLTHHNARVWR